MLIFATTKTLPLLTYMAVTKDDVTKKISLSSKHLVILWGSVEKFQVWPSPELPVVHTHMWYMMWILQLSGQTQTITELCAS